MPNSKIARIVAQIEYKQPVGALEEYKYGVKVRRRTSRSQSEQSPNVIEPSLRELRQELSKPPQAVKMPDPEVLDG